MNSIIRSTAPLTPRQQQALQIGRQINQAFQQVRQTLTQAAGYIWSEPTQAQTAFEDFAVAGFSPADLLPLGAIAQLIPVLIANPSLIQTVYSALGSAAPASLVPEGYALTANPDGSVTVTPPRS